VRFWRLLVKDAHHLIGGRLVFISADLARPLGRRFGFHVFSAARRAAYVASGSEDIDLK
jgi:hypothetical protein